MFPWFSRLSYWLLVRNLRLSWDRRHEGRGEFDHIENQCPIWLWRGGLSSFNWKVKLTSGIRWGHFLDNFQLTFHDPAPPRWSPLPASQWSRCLRGSQMSGVSWRWSMSADFSVSDSQSMTHSGQHRLWPTAEHDYYNLSTINPQHGELHRNNCCRSVALDNSNIQRPVFFIRKFCKG